MFCPTKPGDPGVKVLHAVLTSKPGDPGVKVLHAVLTSSSTMFCPTKPGDPGVKVLHAVLTSPLKIFSKLLMMVGCPNHAFSPFLLLIN